ncbi:hypothetical protein JCM12141A_04450 [Mycolicibacterium hodleri]
MYFRCNECEFIFTDFCDGFTDHQWSEFIYNRDYYATVDPDYAEIRPRDSAQWVATFLAGKTGTTIGLDYGGGNGRMAKYLRDTGWSYDCWDPFGQTDVSSENQGKYNFCSSIEVFEHTPNPLGSLQSLLEKCTPNDLIVMIGTSIHDGVVSDEKRLNWWYAAPRNGHISLYSRKSLQVLAAEFGLTYVSMSRGRHLLVRGHTRREMQTMLLRSKVRTTAREVLRKGKGDS